MIESLGDLLDLSKEGLWKKWQEYRGQKITWRKHWQDLLSLMEWEVFKRELQLLYSNTDSKIGSSNPGIIKMGHLLRGRSESTNTTGSPMGEPVVFNR